MTTKIHAVVDALGNPIRINLSGGNVHDIVPAKDMITGIHASNFLADRAYDCDSLIQLAVSQGSAIVIPPRKNRVDQREYDRQIYKERHLVECFFAKIKNILEFQLVMTNWNELIEPQF